MMNKKLVVCSFLALFQIVGSMRANAVDVIKAEDEDILWDANVYSDETLKGVTTDLTEGEYDRYGRRIVRVEQREPSIGIPMQQIRVPDEVNAKAPLYDNPEIIKTYHPMGNNAMYPADNMKQNRESYRGPINPDWIRKGYTPEMISVRQERISFYRDEIHACMDMHKDHLGIEIEMLNSDGNLYENAAYLSQTLEEVEQCYDNIGLDIIDEFYGHNNDVLRDYNRHSADFHVNGTEASFNPKYCRENCSIRAIAELQLDKFEEFRIYLYKLLDRAPIVPPVAVRQEIVPPEVGDFNQRPNRNNTYNAPQSQMRAAPKSLRVRTPDGEIKYVRLRSDGEYELLDDAPQAQPARRESPKKEFRPLGASGSVQVAPIRLDYDGVPLIDEDDL